MEGGPSHPTLHSQRVSISTVTSACGKANPGASWKPHMIEVLNRRIYP